LAENIIAGRELHASLRDLAGKLVTSGMRQGAAINLLRGLMHTSRASRDKRWQERFDDIPRLVETGNGAAIQSQPRAPWTVPAFTWRDPATIPKREFLYGHAYMRGAVSVTIADGGVGKSNLKIAEMLALATGRNLLGVTPTERVPVLYWNGDDPYVEVERRIHACCHQYDIDARQLAEEQFLFIGTHDKQPLVLGETQRSGLVINHVVANEICSFIQQNKIGFAVFDPFKSTHRVSENDNTSIDAVADVFSLIAERTNAAIGLDHHIRKPSFGQGEATTADSRGAIALINKVRLSRVCNVMTASLAEQARIKEEDRWRYFRVDSGKSNYAPAGKAAWFKLVSVPCANGEDSPTVASWTYPSAFDKVTPDHMHRVRAMAAGGQYREDPQAANWIGIAVADVLGLNAKERVDKKQINAVLKTWFKNGVLAAETRKDEKTRKRRKYVVPGNWTDAAAATP
jgi:hypothetical protein